MADLSIEYDKYLIKDINVTLKRFNYKRDPDELGTTVYWEKLIKEHYWKIPFNELWSNLTIEIWHMDHPDLPRKSKDKEPHLLDYKTDVDGYQTAVGLYFGNERIALGVFPDGWQKQNINDYLPVKQHNVDYTAKALSHELGHWMEDQCGILNPSNKIEKILNQNYFLLKTNQVPNNPTENIAEEIRASLGADWVKGTFSDNKQANLSPKLDTFFKTMYMLSYNLKKENWIDNFIFKDNYVEWKQFNWYNGWKHYALTSNWDKFYKDSTGWHLL